MNALIVYDSNYGNTKFIAEVIGKELGAKAKSVSEVMPESLGNLDLLVVGSPINGWRPTEKTTNFLNSLKKLTGTNAASFDTRVKLFIHGDAAKKISKALEKAGAILIAKPEGFIVLGTEGPLAEGETDKAKKWANMLKEKLHAS